MRHNRKEFRRKPVLVDVAEGPVTPPVQPPQPTYLDDKRMRPTNMIIKAGSKSHHCPNKDDGYHPFTNRCFGQLHCAYCPIHDELVSFRHGCPVKNCAMKGEDLLANTTNPRAVRDHSSKENLPESQTDDRQGQADTAKTNKVVKIDMLKEGDSARDANDKLIYAFGNVHGNDPGLGKTSKAQDAAFYARKAKQTYQRATRLRHAR